jgi:DNA-binding transcriptional ArsR family regulator
VDEQERRAPEADTCEIFQCDAAKVERLRQELAGTEDLALLFKALADPTRVRIALALSKEELCVCDVAHLMSVSVATASHHLRLLRNMGLAKYRREGKLVYYSLDDEHVVTLIQMAMAHVKEGKQR